jgi:RNA polymerase sigma-70 factor (ECF subfamily)
MEKSEVFQSQRPRLFALAYRMLGGVSDAEDVLQDAWLRWARAEARPDSPPAYLRAVVTRLCIDRLRAVKARREDYVGTWLPEPVPQDLLEGTGEEAQALAESLRLGVLVLLERLSPVQRAVFVLRELLGCEYDEIAASVGRTATNCRQIFLRARARLGDELPAPGAAPAEAEAVVGALLGALAARDLPRLTALLTDDALAMSDHGGKASAARNTLRGAETVAKLLHGLALKAARGAGAYTVETRRINGGPGLILRERGRVVSAGLFEVEAGRVARVYFVRNPDKLATLDRAQPRSSDASAPPATP